MPHCNPDSAAAVLALPSIRAIQEYANRALYCCPKKIQSVLTDTCVSVQNFASHDILLELNVSDKNELLGLYRMQDHIRELILYRCPLILYSQSTQENIASVVARVTVYEISHRANCVSLRKQWLDKIRRL